MNRVCWICETRPVYQRKGKRGGWSTYCSRCESACHAMQRYWHQKGMPLAWDGRTHFHKNRSKLVITECAICDERPGTRPVGVGSRIARVCWTCYARLWRRASSQPQSAAGDAFNAQAS